MDGSDLLGRVRDRLVHPASCGVAHVDALVLDALRPGKLLRPDLVVRSAVTAWGERAADPEVQRRVVSGAEAVELLHVATLVHDDVIDRSPLRRGRPSVVATAGVATAIVVGDLLLGRGACAAGASGSAAAVAWARALERMATGQLREELAEPTVAAHAECAALKTASLFRAGAEIGALVAGASAEVVEAHGAFGHHVGMAFQHVDDLLDRFGDPRRMGKPVHLDVANGVPTAVALLGEDPTAGATRLVVAELDAARAALTPLDADPGDLGAWAGRALARTLDAALDAAGRRRAEPLVAAIRVGA